MICATHIHYKAEKYTTAYQFARRAAGLAPKNPYVWGNLANIEHELYRFDQTEFCIQRGLQAAKSQKEFSFLRKIHAAALIQAGDWDRAARASRIAVALQDSAKNRANLGMALLAVGQWEEAWPLYAEIVGRDKSARRMQYVDETVWDGRKGKSIVVYDEQGIGDAITFASVIPDVVKDAKVVMDVRPELESLFKRSFPEVSVYGSFSWGAGVEGEDWRVKHQIDASISLSTVAGMYRPNPESCPGKPYLKADEKAVAKWKAEFAKEGKPVIGIAWTGGIESTAAKFRRVSLYQLLPLFKSVDAVWVSLQYKDAQAEIDAFRKDHPEVDLRQYKKATITNDYDQTASLVAALDLTVSVPTSVVHLAGALGSPCIAMKAPISCWKFNSDLPFHKENMTLIEHRGDWDNTIANAAGVVKARFK